MFVIPVRPRSHHELVRDRRGGGAGAAWSWAPRCRRHSGSEETRHRESPTSLVRAPSSLRASVPVRAYRSVGGPPPGAFRTGFRRSAMTSRSGVPRAS
jgi:hypothetical protein